MSWFSSAYPASKFSEINAAVSGTGSELGVFRLGNDVLQYKPNLLFVEFAVNDQAEDPARIQRAMEGIVRQMWTALPGADICFVYTMNNRSLATMEAGRNPPSVVAMEQVADAYGIPSVNVGFAAAKVIRSGAMTIIGPPPSAATRGDRPVAFSGDGTHPYPTTGHRIYVATLQHAFQIMQAHRNSAMPHRLGEALDPGNLFAAHEIPLATVAHGGGWPEVHLKDPTGQMGRSLPQVLAGRQAGDWIEFQFTGAVFGIYGVKGPDAAEFSVQIDNEPAILQTFFDSYSTAGRYRCRSWISQDLPRGSHHIRITVLGPTKNREKILHQNAVKMDNGGFAMYVGAVLADGPVVLSAQAESSSK